MSIDELIELLEQRKKESPLGGDTIIYHMDEDGRYNRVIKVSLENDSNDPAVILS